MMHFVETIVQKLRDRVFVVQSPEVVRAVIADSLTYLGAPALNDLYRQTERLEEQGIEGILIEAGCASGGSAIVIATAKSKARPFFVYDVFGMIPPPSAEDGEDVHRRYEAIQQGKAKGPKGSDYYGYEPDLYQKVVDNFTRYQLPVAENHIHLVKGLFQDRLYVDSAVALAHIDGDWYESVKVCLERIEPHLVSGGVLVIDDYYHWSGCKKAVDEYFAGRWHEYEKVRRSRLHLIRK